LSCISQGAQNPPAIDIDPSAQVADLQGMSTTINSQIRRLTTATAVMSVLCGLTLVWGEIASAQTDLRPFKAQHQAGFRLGVWSNSGDTPLPTNTNGSLSYQTDFKGGAFYFEGYVGFRFSPALMGELSLGLFNRGEVNLRDDVLLDQFFGNLLVYPLLVRAKFYPIGATESRLQPYLSAGGGFYYARHNIQFYQSDVFFSGFNTQSATSFEYTLGGGLDLPLATKIGLDLNVAWMPLTFSKELITIRNYDGLAITLGVKYLFSTIR
jgi:opacity protein-like surface antigen